MSLGRHKTNWETIAISLLMGVILVAFVCSLFRIIKAPRSSPVAYEAVPAAGTASVVRAGSHYRQYRRSLAVHELGGEWRQSPAAESPQASDYKVANPEMRNQSNPIDPVRLQAGAAPVIPNLQSRPDQRKEDDEKEEESTGWGWLADDIESSRRTKENRAKDREGGEPDAQELADQEEEEEEEEKRDSRAAERERRREDRVYFMDDAYNRAASDGGDTQNQPSGAISFNEYRPGDEKKERPAGDRPYSGSEDLAGFENGQAGGRERETGASPFARTGPDTDAFARGAFTGQSPFDRDSAGSMSPENPAAASALEPAYRSEPGFNAVNSYESPVFGGTRSESVFSTDSLFGGGNLFSSGAEAPPSPSTPLNSTAPAGGDFNSSTRQDTPFRTPSVLSW